MFKFIKQYTETLTGAEFYPVFSLLVFFLFFVALLIYVFSMRKQDINTMANIPLNDETENLNLPNKV
ncbi:MAG: CcoQ/FixQ family Cbb3-type cytochrome c oxidase assembly chaperone [Ferruginibacter sp.]|nr:CcoQ/FixQ family Cbb3-type cytochrome c oxidase assembly chaperone [Ferruginibacter sp.]